MVKWLKVGEGEQEIMVVAKKEGKKIQYWGMYDTTSATFCVAYILNEQVQALFLVEAIEFKEVQL